MPSIKYITIGIILLLIGIAFGWIIKPGTDSGHNHSTGSHAVEAVEESEVWTCSMHPQIRQNEFGICPICEMDLIPLDTDLSTDDPTILQMSQEAVRLAQVETTIAGDEGGETSNTSLLVEAEGTIEMDERTVHVQSSHVAGRIESIDISFEGEYVKAGQKIATIYSTELLAASQELLAAQGLDKSLAGMKEATVQKLKNWKVSDVQIESIISNQKPISTIDIYADHSGYILSKKVALGDYIQQGQALYTIGSTNNLWLILNVYESEFENIRIGQRVRFTTPSTGDREFTTRITYIDPLLNNESRTATIRADINSRSGSLKPGMLVNAKIITPSMRNKEEEGVSIPSSAVLWTGDRSVVYVMLPDREVPTYQFREVEVGNRSGHMTYVQKGLNAGDEVVTNGAFAVDAAAQLNNNMSMMNREVEVKQDVRPDAIPDYTKETPDEFKKQLDVVANAYLDLKDAFVNTDAAMASSMAEVLIDHVGKVDMTLVLDDAHEYWMDQMRAIKSHASKITNLEKVDDQREEFEFVTDALLQSMQAFGTIGTTYYVQYCPMAFNNKGADWISAEEKIQNPYFGDKMMKCGSVKRVLQ